MVLSLSQKKFCGDGKIAGDYHTHIYIYHLNLNLYMQVDAEVYYFDLSNFDFL